MYKVDVDALNYTYRNHALLTNGRPARAVFRKLALGMGVNSDEFDAWSAGKAWGDSN